jgi:hypothetical protein
LPPSMEDRAATSQLLLPATTMKYRLPAALEDRPTTPQLLVSPSAMKEGPSSGQVHAAEGIKEKNCTRKRRDVGGGECDISCHENLNHIVKLQLYLNERTNQVTKHQENIDYVPQTRKIQRKSNFK